MVKSLEITTAKFQFKEALKQKMRAMPAGRRRNWKPPKPAVWLFPSGQQRKYYKEISSFQKKITDFATNRIRERLSGWISDYRGDSHLTFDAYPEDLKFTVEELRKELEGLEENQRIMITNIGFDTGEFNKSQWKKYTKGLLGYEFITEELWEKETINAWSETNFELIKSLSNEYIKKVNTIVSEGVQFGRTYDEIMRQIVKEKKSTEGWQSMRIARDQVGKLNGRFTERRQTEVGIEMYTWSNVGDRRVRGNPGGAFPKAIPSHWDNAIGGKLCRWDDPTLYGVYDADGKIIWKKRTALMPLVHPGYEILCRCTAIPIFDNIVSEVKSEIEEEEKLKRPTEEIKKPIPERKAVVKKPEVEKEFLTQKETNTDKAVTEVWDRNREGTGGIKFSNKEYDSLERYKEDTYKKINQDLLGSRIFSGVEKKKINDYIKTIDGAFKKSKLKQNVVTWRGVDSYSLASSAEDLLGKEMKGTSFWSTTLDRKRAEKFLEFADEDSSVLLKIKAKKGTRALNMETFKEAGSTLDEQEILLDRLQNYKVSKITRRKGKSLIMELEAI